MAVKNLRAALCVALMAVSFSAAAEDGPAPFPDFTFKRVKPPAANAQKRITVQIAPAATPAPPSQSGAPTTQVAAAAPNAPLPFRWFWSELDATASADAARATRAVDLIAERGGQVPEPRLQTLQSTA